VSAPVVVSVEPGNLETDVILGIPIIITFDQVIDQTTVNDATFALTGPGTTEVETAMNMATLGKLSPTGREYITGTFTFVTTGNIPPNTVVSFVPSRALRNNTTYSVLLLGSSGSIISNGVRNPAYEGMVNSYEWSFTTGTLDVTVPPTRSLRPVGHQDLARACGTGIVCGLLLPSAFCRKGLSVRWATKTFGTHPGDARQE